MPLSSPRLRSTQVRCAPWGIRARDTMRGPERVVGRRPAYDLEGRLQELRLRGQQHRLHGYPSSASCSRCAVLTAGARGAGGFGTLAVINEIFGWQLTAVPYQVTCPRSLACTRRDTDGQHVCAVFLPLSLLASMHGWMDRFWCGRRGPSTSRSATHTTQSSRACPPRYPFPSPLPLSPPSSPLPSSAPPLLLFRCAGLRKRGLGTGVGGPREHLRGADGVDADGRALLLRLPRRQRRLGCPLRPRAPPSTDPLYRPPITLHAQ